MPLFYPLNSLEKGRYVLLHLDFPSRLKHSSAGSCLAVGRGAHLPSMVTHGPAWTSSGVQPEDITGKGLWRGTQPGRAGSQASLCSWCTKSQPCQDLSLLYPIHKHPKCQVLGLLSWSGTSLLDAAVQALVWCKRVWVLQQSHRFRSDTSLDWFYWHTLESEAVAAKSA